MKFREVMQARWAEMETRERRLVTAAVTLVLLALVWWVALAPALNTLSAAREEHKRLDAQLQRMSTLQAQAKALQSQPRANRDESLRALESSVRQSLGASAQVVNAGDAANVMMRAAPADALAQWLAQARNNARAVPREAHLTRAASAGGASATSSASATPGLPTTPGGPLQPGTKSGAGNSAAAAGAADEGRPRWDGTLVMSLPAASR
ncbi:type II secretion system protein GspM [Variovorax sp. dw_954]|uniref:type II secretion system protein GspM n=2 Tax=unclassified Variovorax TaxID=663243 RepID=UPI001BD24A9A|nr:type II secretion system protein GspM [Variovorax sp. dw_954]